MAAAESSAGKFLKGETAASIQRAAGTEVVCTARDHWGDQFVSVRHRGCIVHWGPEQSRKYLEVVLAAAAEVAAGTTVEAAADRIRAYVVDAIGEERLEPETAAGATNKSGDEKLGEEAAAEAAKEKKREKQRKKKQRRRQRNEAAAAEDTVTDTAVAGDEVVETTAAADSLEAAALAVAEAAAALKAYSGTTEGATAVATGAIGSIEAVEGTPERMREKVWDTTCGGTEVQTVQTAEMVAEGVEETAADPAIAGEVVVEAADSAEAANMKKAAQHWEIGRWNSRWWRVAQDRGWRMDRMQIGDIWQWQKKQIRQRAVVQQWQKVAARRKERKVAKAVAEEVVQTVEAAATEEAVVDAAVGAGETTAEAVAAAEADGTAVDWNYFLAAAEEAEEEFEEWWQQQAADEDMMQWVEQIEQQAAAGESEVVQVMVQAAEAEAEAAAETVVWDTGEAVAEAEGEEIAAAVSEIVAAAATEMAATAEVEKQLRELQYKMEQLEAMEIEVEVEAAEMQVEAAEVEDEAAVGDQNKVFDPGGSVWGAVL